MNPQNSIKISNIQNTKQSSNYQPIHIPYPLHYPTNIYKLNHFETNTLVFYQNIQLSKNMEIQPIINSLGQTKVQPNNTIRLFKYKKWKQLIVNTASDLQQKYIDHIPLITDLQTIGKAIPEEYLIEATMGIKAFKPQFLEQKPILESTTVSTLSETIIKAAKYKQQNKYHSPFSNSQASIRQKTFSNQFNKKSHPFRFMIKNTIYLLQLKYKALINNQNITMEDLQKSIKLDISIYNQFMVTIAQPYKELFDHQNQEQNQALCSKFDNFFRCFINTHPKILRSIHTILLYYCRLRYSQIVTQKFAQFPLPHQYDIPKQFQIDGCYIRAMNSLMQFGTYHIETIPHKSMAKLIELRKNILNDIDEYYLHKQGETKQLELNAEIQIEIIRFIISKLKDWSIEIYTELKFLEYIYGDEEIAYKYEQASFMYTQLIMAFQIAGFQSQ